MLTGTVVSRLSGHDACVRDVSWHPYKDNIVSSSVSAGFNILLNSNRFFLFGRSSKCVFLSAVGRSGADVGAQADPSSRGGEGEGERLTAGHRLGSAGEEERLMSEEVTSRRKGARQDGLHPPDTGGNRETSIFFKFNAGYYRLQLQRGL